MMDFLRRLAPVRETDATRAVAVLPSRFASESPLRATALGARPAQHSEGEVPLSFDVASAPANTAAAKRDSTHTSVGAPDVDQADPRDVQDTHDASSAHAKSISPASSTSAATQAIAKRHGRHVVPLPDQPRATLPLSKSILTQRRAQARDDGHVVHVTIGRIDVVATTGAAPAVRRDPTPRKGMVTLADYLRGGNGSRR